ncbi:MAG: death domain-containing protein, partial [Proteobacteria bacterium]|nr:death domain-containing protein [Pseudomonadota bacterium]
MAVPTYDELLAHYEVDSSTMRETFDDKHLRQFSLTLDIWETLARFLEMPTSDIANIKSQGDAVVQSVKMLEHWKQRRGSMATYEAMVKVLLQISRTDLAEKIITLRKSSSRSLKNITAETPLCLDESSLALHTSPASSDGVDNAASSDVISTLRELEEEFYSLVIFIEDTLENSKVSLDSITRRFRMLPQSIQRQYETDENYKETRRRILRSKTVKKLFDNLTELKHWNYMTPDTLAHILKDVKIDGMHKKIDEYKDKLMAFKANTKLRELVGISFPVPDYCMELAMEVEGWEDKTIQEVEERAVNIVRRAAYS